MKPDSSPYYLLVNHTDYNYLFTVVEKFVFKFILSKSEFSHINNVVWHNHPVLENKSWIQKDTLFLPYNEWLNKELLGDIFLTIGEMNPIDTKEQIAINVESQLRKYFNNLIDNGKISIMDSCAMPPQLESLLFEPSMGTLGNNEIERLEKSRIERSPLEAINNSLDESKEAVMLALMEQYAKNSRLINEHNFFAYKVAHNIKNEQLLSAIERHIKNIPTLKFPDFISYLSFAFEDKRRGQINGPDLDLFDYLTIVNYPQYCQENQPPPDKQAKIINVLLQHSVDYCSVAHIKYVIEAGLYRHETIIGKILEQIEEHSDFYKQQCNYDNRLVKQLFTLVDNISDNPREQLLTFMRKIMPDNIEVRAYCEKLELDDELNSNTNMPSKNAIKI